MLEGGRARLLHVAIWLATLFFTAMLFVPLLREALRRVTDCRPAVTSDGGGRLLVVMDDEQPAGCWWRCFAPTATGGRGRDPAAALADRPARLRAVLSALRMPQLDGPALSRRCGAVAAQMPALIFVTQPAFAPDLARFLMESAASLLPWPARPADVSRIVARSLVPTPA